MAVCIYYLPGIIWIYLRHDRELWIQSRWDPVPTKDMSTNLSARISQRAHIKYFIQFGVSPLLPLLAHHTEGHLCFMLFSDECTKWNVTLSPWIWHLSRWVCWPQGQLITPVWIWTSWATVHPLAGPLLPLPQCVVTQLQRKCTHTEFESQAIRIGSPLPQYWYFNWG